MRADQHAVIETMNTAHSAQERITTLLTALTKISDLTSERVRTKVEMASLIDQIGVAASEAIVAGRE